MACRFSRSPTRSRSSSAGSRSPTRSLHAFEFASRVRVRARVRVRPRSAGPVRPRSASPVGPRVAKTWAKNSTRHRPRRTLRDAIDANRRRRLDRDDAAPASGASSGRRWGLRTTLCIARGQPLGQGCGATVHDTRGGSSTGPCAADPQRCPRRETRKRRRDPAISDSLPIIHRPYFEGWIPDLLLSLSSQSGPERAKVRLTRAACQRKGRRASGPSPAC